MSNNVASLSISSAHAYQEQLAFINTVRETIKLCYPPRKKGYVRDVQAKIKTLVESSFASSHRLMDELKEIASYASDDYLKSKDFFKRQCYREGLVSNLEYLISHCLPPLPLKVAQQLLSNKVQESDEKLWQESRYSVDYIPVCGFNPLGYAAFNGYTKRVQWLLQHSSEVNYVSYHWPSPSDNSVFQAARSSNLKLRLHLDLVGMLLKNGANAMARDLSGKWGILKCYKAPISVFQMMLESVTDMSLAKGTVVRGERCIRTNVLEELLRIDDEEQILDKAKLFIFHGLETPEEIRKEKVERGRVTLMSKWRVARSEFLEAEQIYRKIREDVCTLTKQTVTDGLGEYPKVIFELIMAYFVDDHSLRITVSRKCIQVIRLGANKPSKHYLFEKDPWAFSGITKVWAQVRSII